MNFREWLIKFLDLGQEKREEIFPPWIITHPPGYYCLLSVDTTHPEWQKQFKEQLKKFRKIYKIHDL